MKKITATVATATALLVAALPSAGQFCISAGSCVTRYS